MRDKRKFIFIIFCLVIIIFSEFLLYKKAKVDDENFKSQMKEKLTPITTQLDLRGFKLKNNNIHNRVENGIIDVERNSENSNYGYLKIKYNENGEIDDAQVLLEYSKESYSDDIYSDCYYVFSLLGIDLYENKYEEAIDILEDTNNTEKIDSEIAENVIIINDKEYKFTVKNIKNENKIQFCLE